MSDHGSDTEEVQELDLSKVLVLPCPRGSRRHALT